MSILEEHIPYALKQFKIDTIVPIEIFGVDASLTNVSSAKIATAIVVVSYLYYAMRDATLVPRRFQVSAEMIYGLISNTVVGVAGLEAKPAIPFVFTLFTFVLFGTLIGLTPLHVTFTSHLINTLALSFIVFAYANILGFGRHGFGFLRILLPRGVPLFVAPVLVVVEIVSYLFRPITLGFRLFANIFAGHVMLKLFADFCSMLVTAFGSTGVVATIFPLLIMVVLYGFEVMITCIQAYIFVHITSMYLRD